jgi:hypothetical protein
MSLLATIDALHAELDANPEAHDTRGILADALEDMGGEWAVLAPGYRALAALQYFPGRDCGPRDEPKPDARWTYGRSAAEQYEPHEKLPDDWHRLLRRNDFWAYFPSRREADDQVAKAFSLLPAERQQVLLAAPVLAGGE